MRKISIDNQSVMYICSIIIEGFSMPSFFCRDLMVVIRFVRDREIDTFVPNTEL